MGKNGEEQNKQSGILLLNKHNKIKSKERPWKIMIQNMEGLVSKNSKEKVELLKEYVKENNIIIMNLTETWLDNTVEEIVEIEGYRIFRGDRKNRERGGTAIYVHDKIETNIKLQMSNGKCEVVAVEMPDIQTLNIVVYRPPDTKSNEFNPILSEIQNILQNLKKPEPTIILSGDLNFPFVKWKRLPDNSCSWEYKPNTNATADEKQQFERLFEMCENHFMLQMIEEPTRKENTLDLMFTNEVSLVTMVEVTKSSYSDHDIIEMSTNYSLTEKEKYNTEQSEDNEFRTLNFRTKTVKWKNIIRMMEDLDWDQEFESGDSIAGGKNMIEKFSKCAKENAPKRNTQSNRSKIPRERKKLHNRIKMLKRKKHNAYSKERKRRCEKEILETDKKIIESKRNERLEKEKQCIESMKENPKVFYSFINKQRNRRVEVGPFKRGETFIYNGKEISNCLKTEFTSQMSERTSRQNPVQFDEVNEGDLYDIEVTRKKVEDAIDEIDELRLVPLREAKRLYIMEKK